MKNKTNEELQALVAKATAGDKKALETLIAGVPAAPAFHRGLWI